MKQENYIKGMVMIILSAFFFACMNVSVRLAGDLPSVQKSFFRNLVAAVFAAIILTRKHMVPRVQKQYWGPLSFVVHLEHLEFSVIFMRSTIFWLRTHLS